MTLPNHTTSQEPSVFDEYMGVISHTIEEWKANNPPEKIKESVLKKIRSSQDEITMKLLGFDSRYSKAWELDHCNGRSGNSTAGDYLRTHANAAVTEWLQSAYTPLLSPDEMAALAKEMKKEYRDTIRKSLRAAINKKADEDAAKFINELIDSKNVDGLLRLQNLIG